MSIKGNLRKAIISIAVVAATVFLFTGCTEDETQSNEELSTPGTSSGSVTVIDSTSSKQAKSNIAGSGSDVSDNIEESKPGISEPVQSSASISSSKPEPVTSSTTDSKPVQSTPVSSSKPAESSKPAQSTTPVQSSKPVQSTPAQSQEEFVTDGNKSAQSSSTPAQSTPTSSSGGNVYEPGKYTGYTPTDTKGVALDANGCPADGKAWIKSGGSSSFVDATGQLWTYRPSGWRKAGTSTITDGTGVVPSGNLLGY